MYLPGTFVKPFCRCLLCVSVRCSAKALALSVSQSLLGPQRQIYGEISRSVHEVHSLQLEAQAPIHIRVFSMFLNVLHMTQATVRRCRGAGYATVATSRCCRTGVSTAVRQPTWPDALPFSAKARHSSVSAALLLAATIDAKPWRKGRQYTLRNLSPSRNLC